MEPPSEEKRRSHVITIDPNETILTAFPYRPHNSLLDILKGEPKVLGATQILLSLVIVGLGIILALNFIFFSKKFPLVILTGYPFWGAVIFFLTGFITVFNDKLRRNLRPGVTTMNILSSLVALAGIALILVSFTQQHKFCQAPSLEGTCVVGRTLLLGILSILLIITIVELSISVTIASLRSNCWTSSRKAVFFFPSEVPQNTEQPVPEENNQLQFEFQGKSPSDNTTSNITAIFLGGYAFFKLRGLRNPSAPKNISRKSDKGTSSMHVPDEQETIPPPSLEEETKLDALLPPLTPKSSENIPSQKESRSNNLNDEGLESITRQTSDLQPKLIDDQNMSPKFLKTPSSHNFSPLLPDSLSSQTMAALSTQVLQSKPPSSRISQSYDLTSEDLPSEDIPSQETPSQDMQFQDTLTQSISSQETQSQDIPYQDILTQDIPSQETPSLETPSQELSFQDTLTKDTSSQDTPSQNTLFQETPYQYTPSQKIPHHYTPSPKTPSPKIPSPKIPSQESPYQNVPSPKIPSPKTPSQESPYQDVPSPKIPSPKTPSQESPYQDIPSPKIPSPKTPSQESPYQDIPSPKIPSPKTPSQESPYQDTPSPKIPSPKTPSQESPYQDTLTLDIPSQRTQSEETPSQEIPSQETPSHDLKYQDVLSPEKISQSTQTQDTVAHDMSFSDLQALNTEVQIQQDPEIFYRDIRTEVMELTQEWKSNMSKKTPRRLSLSLPGKHKIFPPKRHSLDLQIKGDEAPRRHSVDVQRKTSRRKSIDQQIKAWLSTKKHTTEKQDAYTQTSELFLYQQADQQQVKEEEVPVQQPQDEQSKDQKSVEELYPGEQLNGKEEEDQQSDEKPHPEEQVQPSEDKQPLEQKALNSQEERQQALVRRTPMPSCLDWDSQSFQFSERSCSYWSTPSWQPVSLGSQDWRSQGWRNKDWKAQEWQFEIQPSLDWESQELLERESLRQRALYQEVQPRSTIVQHTQDRQLRNFVFQVGLCQGNDQQSGVLRGDMYAADDVQTRDREPQDTEDIENTCSKPKDQQSEDTRPDNYPVSCQSLVPYTYITCLSNIASEQEVQNNMPCSDSSKDLNVTSSSCYQKDQQQSEDSD
ncbi:membrane-spanning 4-domains subfamily A member 14 [Chionomys nivalis]|uniref:membrane-spanning 4-domains subfamily A member 14 n=1 Tax=Chionomys nivalis TaxID=269649 RepID=UPI002591EA87|nr:membrane-spanning 4-domains subfamily A member 14 [Chionomys nivalis]